MCPALCNTMDYIVHEIPQPRILEWVTFPFSRGSSQPRNRTQVSGIAADSLSAEPQSESEVAQSCLTLCDPVDSSPPYSSVHGILQAKILEWVAISFSRGSSWPRDRTQVSRIAGRCFNLWATREAHAEPQGKPKNTGVGSLSLLQWIFLTQESNWGLLHCRLIL